MTVKVGTTFAAPLMDGRPTWTVLEVLMGRVVLATTGPDWPDAPNHEAAFKIEVVQASIAHDERIDASRAANDMWWAQQTVGSVRHYHNGFGEYVRCVVDGDRNLQPVALVGNWTAHQDFYISRIEDGSGAWRQHVSCVFEAPGFVAPRHKDAPADPTVLRPLAYVPSGRNHPQFVMVEAD